MISKIMRLIFCGILFTILVSVGHAPEASTINGTGIIEVDETSEEVVLEATLLAKEDAWDNFIRSLDDKHLGAYLREKTFILKNLDTFITQTQILDQNFNESDEELTVKVSITVNKKLFAATLKIEPDKPKKPKKAKKNSLIVALFVARQAASAKEFDARRVKISKKSASSMAKEGAQASGGKSLSTTSTKNMTKSASGGSVVRKADEINYKIISAEPIDNAMLSVFTAANYEAAPYDDVAEECGGDRPVFSDKIKAHFKSHNEWQRSLWKSARKAAKECGNDMDLKPVFFARGTMTADVARVNIKTGLKEVHVRVRGAVYNVTARLPKLVATIEPQQYGGLGPNEDIARTTALSRAGTKAGELIVEMLLAKGL